MSQSKQSRDSVHHSQVITEQHQRRMARGQKETSADEIRKLPDDLRAMRDARWRAEDRKLLRELGINGELA